MPQCSFIRYALLSLAVILLATGVSGFAPHSLVATTSTARQPSCRAAGPSPDDDIEALEAKLEELRALKEKEEEEEKQRSVADQSNFADVQGKEIFLSEGDLIDANILDDSSEGLSVPQALGAVALLVGILFFAQVPVGQEDYQKYGATGSKATMTKQIDLGDLNRDAPRP